MNHNIHVITGAIITGWLTTSRNPQHEVKMNWSSPSNPPKEKWQSRIRLYDGVLRIDISSGFSDGIRIWKYHQICSSILAISTLSFFREVGCTTLFVEISNHAQYKAILLVASASLLPNSNRSEHHCMCVSNVRSFCINCSESTDHIFWYFFGINRWQLWEYRLGIKFKFLAN